MINSIELRNWKTHKDTRLKFSKGTNILLGQMGAGKSSIMDAISFALFGTYPAIQHRRVAVDEIIMNRPQQEDAASVSLDFGVDGADYRIERNLQLSGSTKASIAKGGAYLQSQPQRVNEEVERILKVDYDLFSRAVYSEQNRLTYFLDLRPAERKKQIDELLGLDKFATAQENATSLINRIKDIVSESEKAIANFDVKKLREQHKALLDEAANVTKEREELAKELESQEKKRESLNEELEKTKKAYNRRISLTKEIAELKSRIGVVEKEIEKIKKKGVADNAATRKALSEKKKELDSLVAEGKKVEDAEKKAFEELAHITASKGEQQKWLTELEKHLSKCPICERDLPEEIRKRIVEEKTSLIAKIEEQAKTQREANLALKRKKEEVSDSVSKARDALAKLDMESEAAERLEGHITDRDKSMKMVGEREKELGAIKVDEESIDKMQKEFTQVNVKIRECSTKIDASSKAEKEKVAQAQEKKKEIETIDKMQEDARSKKKATEDLVKFKEALAETQTLLRTRLIGSINEIMDEIWPELYPYGDYQGLLLEPTADDYMLKVRTSRTENGGWTNVDTIASGGEKSVACLAMRVAFALVLVPNLRWMILDEPTHNIDQQGLSKFVKAINEVLPRLVEQVFIITHDEMLKQAVNAKIYVLSRNKEESEGTVVQAY
ncbi:MAG: AAA family ATPase [Candidatus Micrarchaeota archaeon]|nr:AAA family ATPase [Candidatus Micrarchaeota archaeon]